MWWIFALLSAVFAALTSILAKVGIEDVDSTLATAIRTVAVVGMSWLLSGLATGASWLCYYKAIQMGDVSKVVPIDKLSVLFTLILAFIFLHEEFNVKSLIGSILITAGTLFMVL